ncbi:MAG: hypothetical protein M1536_02475 [Firmicutes bacterium]|nr:hypothetical protein [Bacillota bacterium]
MNCSTCFQLTVTDVTNVQDLHLIDNAHAGHTHKLKATRKDGFFVFYKV